MKRCFYAQKCLFITRRLWIFIRLQMSPSSSPYRSCTLLRRIGSPVSSSSLSSPWIFGIVEWTPVQWTTSGPAVHLVTHDRLLSPLPGALLSLPRLWNRHSRNCSPYGCFLWGSEWSLPNPSSSSSSCCRWDSRTVFSHKWSSIRPSSSTTSASFSCSFNSGITSIVSISILSEFSSSRDRTSEYSSRTLYLHVECLTESWTTSSSPTTTSDSSLTNVLSSSSYSGIDVRSNSLSSYCICFSFIFLYNLDSTSSSSSCNFLYYASSPGQQSSHESRIITTKKECKYHLMTVLKCLTHKMNLRLKQTKRKRKRYTFLWGNISRIWSFAWKWQGRLRMSCAIFRVLLLDRRFSLWHTQETHEWRK